MQSDTDDRSLSKSDLSALEPSPESAFDMPSSFCITSQDGAQIIDQLPVFEQKIVHLFLNNLPHNENLNFHNNVHKFFDPLAGP